MASQRARHIQVSSPADCDRLKALLDQGADFADLAAAHSVCSTATQGGELGCFKPGFLPEVVTTALANAQVGELVGPLQSPWGFHLLEVTEREAS